MTSVERFERYVEQFRRGSKSYPISNRKHEYQAPRGSSEGERHIHRILKEMGYKYMEDYVSEYSVEELGRLRFDFFLRGVKLFIEFDGSQHYEGSRFHGSREEWLEAIQRDESKNKFCLERGFSLLRIPHVYSKSYSKLRQLIFDFINRVSFSDVPVVEVDLYFKWKAGKLNL